MTKQQQPDNRNETLSDKAFRVVNLALKNLILSKVPVSFNNSFKLDEESVSIEQDGGEYDFFIIYEPTKKASDNLLKYYIEVYVTTRTNQYTIYLCDQKEGDFILKETTKNPEELIGIYYKWVATEFPKL